MTLTARAASLADAEAIAAIYNQGIADRVGTFETDPRTKDQIEPWFDGQHPIVVVEDGGEVVAFASTSSYRSRPCYAGIAEFSVYVARDHRGIGAYMTFGRNDEDVRWQNRKCSLELLCQRLPRW